MVDRIAFNKAAENLIEITKVFVEENAEYDLLENIESSTWNEKFIDWSNEFEEQHKTTDWNRETSSRMKKRILIRSIQIKSAIFQS